jgi:hypothetical protein
MYKDEKRSELELRLFRLSMLHATFGMYLMKHLMDVSVSHPCI